MCSSTRGVSAASSTGRRAGSASATRAYDVGATAAILAHGPVDVPDLLASPINLGRRCSVAAYRRAYVRDRAIDRDRIRYYEALRSLVFLVEAGAARQAEAGIIPPILKRTAFGDERTVRGVVQRFNAITGETLQIPMPAGRE
jgi:hypothetical protein